MEHRRHLLPAGGHQHRRDIHTPCMRNEKNHLLIIALHLVDDRFPLPVNAGKDFLRIAQAQLGHHHHCLRRRGIHGVDNRFPLVLAFSGKQYSKLICARRRELSPDAPPDDRVCRGADRERMAASAQYRRRQRPPARRPSSAAVKRIFQT